MESSISLVVLVLLANMAFGHLRTGSDDMAKGPSHPSDRSGYTQSENMQKDFSDLFDIEIESLEERLITNSNGMITDLFGRKGTGSTKTAQAQKDLDDLATQLRNMRRDMESMSTTNARLEKQFSSALRSRSGGQGNTMNLAALLRDLKGMSTRIAVLAGSVNDLHARADDIPVQVKRPMETTGSRPADCEAVKRCNDQYWDGEYYVYPTSLGGQRVKVFCVGMGTPNTAAYISLHNENTATYNYSLRYDTDSCSFRDRVGDVKSTFRRIRVNLEDMTVARHDFTFSHVINENQASHEDVKYGAGGGCSWDYAYRRYEDCPAPGGFVIDTEGTGLIVDPQLQWTTYGYGSRIDDVIRTNHNRRITAACDGWCAWCYPDGEMTLQIDPSSEPIGDATEPICT